jgi:hypothetical protein
MIVGMRCPPSPSKHLTNSPTIRLFSQPLLQIQPILSLCWPTVVLTGVAFCGDCSDDVAVSAYDHDEIRIYKP